MPADSRVFVYLLVCVSRIPTKDGAALLVPRKEARKIAYALLKSRPSHAPAPLHTDCLSPSPEGRNDACNKPGDDLPLRPYGHPADAPGRRHLRHSRPNTRADRLGAIADPAHIQVRPLSSLHANHSGSADANSGLSLSPTSLLSLSPEPVSLPLGIDRIAQQQLADNAYWGHEEAPSHSPKVLLTLASKTIPGVPASTGQRSFLWAASLVVAVSILVSSMILPANVLNPEVHIMRSVAAVMLTLGLDSHMRMTARSSMHSVHHTLKSDICHEE